MKEKTYLKWYNKVGYGSGDIAGNVVYAFLSSFVMIYLTNTVGLNPGIIGTLIAVSKLFEVEQNAQMALSVADRAYVLETGRVVMEGTGAELLTNERVRSAYLGG